MARPKNVFSAGDDILAEKMNENFEEIWAGVNIYGESLEGSDDYAITVDGVESYSEGMVVVFKADVANTGACSFNVNELGAKAIKKYIDGSMVDLDDNDIEAGQLVYIIYDGTNFQYVNFKGKYKIVCGNDSRDISLTGNQTITHNLGRTPKKIRIKAIINTSQTWKESEGVWVNGSALGVLRSDGAFSLLDMINIGSSGNFGYAEISSFNSTTFVLSWDKVGSPKGTVNFIWEVE